MAIKTIIVTAIKIRSTAGKINAGINLIRQIRQRVQSLREERLQQVWRSSENVDSNIFKQRMQEMDTDIQKMLDALDQYEQVLRTSADQFQAKQETVRSEAQALQSPRNR